MNKEPNAALDRMPYEISDKAKYEPAMEIDDQQAADEYFERLVEHTMRFGATRAQAEATERTNLGYYAGYYDGQTRARVEKLFRCAHPLFGPIAVNGPPTPETAFNIGTAIGEAFKQGLKAGAKP